MYVGKSSPEPEIFIDGIRRHRRDLYDKYGTSSIKKLKEILGNRIQIGKKNQKYKYIYILSNKRERKEIMKKLKVKIIKDYPKGDSQYYNVGVS